MQCLSIMIVLMYYGHFNKISLKNSIFFIIFYEVSAIVAFSFSSEFDFVFSCSTFNLCFDLVSFDLCLVLKLKLLKAFVIWCAVCHWYGLWSYKNSRDRIGIEILEKVDDECYREFWEMILYISILAYSRNLDYNSLLTLVSSHWTLTPKLPSFHLEIFSITG